MTDFDLPQLIEIEPIHSCNLRCIMCHVSYEKLSNTRLDITKFFEHLCDINGKNIIVGATHEPAMHPQFTELMTGLSERGANLELTTNGSILTPKIVESIKNCNFKHIIISFDGITKETCESVRHNLKYEQTLKQILAFKNTITSNSLFSINYTVLKKNMHEMLAATQFWNEQGFDHIGFIMMAIRNEVIKNESPQDCMPVIYEKLEQIARYIIENSCKLSMSSSALVGVKTLRQTYPDCFRGNYVKSKNSQACFIPIVRDVQKGDFPGMPVSCRSPFTYARILYSGEVQLCAKFVIGNIYEKSFEDIWFGEQANGIRNMLMENPKICHQCDYYRFCLCSIDIDLANEKNFFADGVGVNKKEAIFSLTPQLLLEGYLDFNIIAYQGNIYAIHQNDGAFDFEKVKRSGYKHLIKGATIEEVKKLIEQKYQQINPASQKLTIPQALQMINQMLQKQQLQPAEKLCRQVLQAAPNNLQAQYLLDKILHQAKHNEQLI